MKKNRSLIEFLVIFALVAVVGLALRGEKPEPSASPSPGRLATPAMEPPTAVETPEPTATPSQPKLPLDAYSGLVPLKGKEGQAPAITESEILVMKTDLGEVKIEVYPQAAPRSAERFLELADIGFYDGTVVSRVVPDFVVQFGINPEMKEWKNREFKDDPSLFQHLPGTIAFAKAGKDTNTTQVFINLSENNRLANPDFNFCVFGRVVEGMEHVREFAEVGEPGMGLNQQRLWTDPDYPDSLAKKPSQILSIGRP